MCDQTVCSCHLSICRGQPKVFILIYSGVQNSLAEILLLYAQYDAILFALHTLKYC